MILEVLKLVGIIEKIDMDFSIILLLPNGINLGFNYFPADTEHNYEELNIYLLIVQLKWRFHYE